MYILNVNKGEENDRHLTERNEDEPIAVQSSKIEDKKVIVIRPVDNNFVMSKTQSETESEESLSSKMKEAGESLKDLIFTLGKRAKIITKDTTQEIKSKTIDISNSADAKDIRTLGANVESIIATFEDMMKEIRKEGYNEQEELLSRYKNFLEAEIKVIEARLNLGKRLKPGA